MRIVILFLIIKGEYAFLLALHTDGWADGGTYTFFGIFSSYWLEWYITLSCYLNKHRPSAEQYVSTVNCET